MAGSSTVYVKSTEAHFEQDWERIGEVCETMAPSTQEGLVMWADESKHEMLIRVAEVEELERLLPDLAKVSDAEYYGFSYETIVDAFVYWHYIAGQQVRYFEFGMFDEERTWNELVGTPESWEAEVFFSESEMEAQRAFCLDAEELVVWEKMCSEKRLRLGVRLPFMGGLGSLQIPVRLGFPGIVEPANWTREQRFEKPRPVSWWRRIFQR